MGQIKIFSGAVEDLEKQANDWLKKNPAVRVDKLNVSSETISGRGTFATIVILYNEATGKSGDPIGDI